MSLLTCFIVKNIEPQHKIFRLVFKDCILSVSRFCLTALADFVQESFKKVFIYYYK